MQGPIQHCAVFVFVFLNPIGRINVKNQQDEYTVMLQYLENDTVFCNFVFGFEMRQSKCDLKSRPSCLN